MLRATWDRDVFHGTYTATSVTVTITQALSLYNCIELLLLIFVTFKKYKGLYFYSLTIATLGTICYCVGLMVSYFSDAALWVGKIFDSTGWMVMVTGQSLVLYSRLGIILANRRILWAVKWMIIIDAILFHGITTVVDWGRYTGNEAYSDAYFYIEYIQMTGFCIQEFIISGLYLWKTVKLLRIISKEGVRRTMWQLFTINVVIIILDIALLAIQYRNLHIYETVVKAFVYSVKLKLEFSILGKLIDIVQENKRSLSVALGDAETCLEHPNHPIHRNPSSPTIHQQASVFSSQPDHIMLADKGVFTYSQHLEHSKQQETPSSLRSDGSVTDAPRAQSVASLTTQARRRGARESEIEYAEIVRSLSST